MQATYVDKAAIVKSRASAKFGVPTKSTAKPPKPSGVDPLGFETHVERYPLAFDLDGNPPSLFEPSCRDVTMIARAAGMMEALVEDGCYERALYLIQVDDDPIVKVGVSCNPVKRLEQLQAANYRELFLWCVVFTASKQATTLERRVLEWASESGNRLHGEWINSEPHMVFEKVIDFATEHQIPTCNAEIWLDNHIQRVKRAALRMGKRVHRRTSWRHGPAKD